MATLTSDLGPASIVVLTAANGYIVNGLNGTSPRVVMSLPSALTADSATFTSLQTSDFELITPSEISGIVAFTGSVDATHKVIIIGVAVSLGLACTISLFVFIITCWRRKKVQKNANSSAKSARSSLEIRCIGIKSTAPTDNISPIPPLKTKATLGAPGE